ncbi:MAG: hypothetical protein FD148_2653 [Methylocystaceae bacterium]|nr:MAG: hypothetical protein FD148_2653 [Methylocystaceae bacterium]
MGNFMRHHRRRLRRVAGKRQQSARDVKIAGGQREGVDHRRIENCHLVGWLAGRFADARELGENAIKVMLCARSLIFAAELSDELLMLNRAAVIGSRTSRPRGRQWNAKELSLPLELRAAADRQADDSQQGERRPPNERGRRQQTRSRLA